MHQLVIVTIAMGLKKFEARCSVCSQLIDRRNESVSSAVGAFKEKKLLMNPSISLLFAALLLIASALSSRKFLAGGSGQLLLEVEQLVSLGGLQVPDDVALGGHFTL